MDRSTTCKQILTRAIAFSLHTRKLMSTQDSDASTHWGINQSISYGPKTPILEDIAGIIDTGMLLARSMRRCITGISLRAGSAFILLATDAYDNYVTATGAVMDDATGLLQITSAQYNNLQSLFFHINGVNISTSFHQDVTDLLIYVNLRQSMS
jgi:hypothetical protein